MLWNVASPTMTGFVVGATLAVVAGVALSAYGGVGVALLIPFAAALLGGIGAGIGKVVGRGKSTPR